MYYYFCRFYNWAMKKIFSFIFIFSLVLSAVFSDADQEVLLKLSETHDAEQAYQFMLGYDAILQERVVGALMVYNPETDNFEGWATSITPSGFFDKQHSENVAVYELLPCNVLKLMYRTLGDTATISFLQTRDDKEILMSVIIFRPPEDGIYYDTPQYLTEKALMDSITTHGLSEEDFIKILSSLGLSKDDVMAVVLNGEKEPNTIVEEVLKTSSDTKGFSLKRNSVAIIALVVFVLLCLLLFLLFRYLKLSHNNKEEN